MVVWSIESVSEENDLDTHEAGQSDKSGCVGKAKGRGRPACGKRDDRTSICHVIFTKYNLLSQLYGYP